MYTLQCKHPFLRFFYPMPPSLGPRGQGEPPEQGQGQVGAKSGWVGGLAWAGEEDPVRHWEEQEQGRGRLQAQFRGCCGPRAEQKGARAGHSTEGKGNKLHLRQARGWVRTHCQAPATDQGAPGIYQCMLHLLPHFNIHLKPTFTFQSNLHMYIHISDKALLDFNYVHLHLQFWQVKNKEHKILFIKKQENF